MRVPLHSLGLAIAVLFAAFTTANAQFSFGVHGGGAFSNAKISNDTGLVDDDTDTKIMTSFVVGIPLELRVSDAFAIQPEVNLLRQGFRLSEDFGGETLTAKLQFNAVEVPVLAKIGRLVPGEVSFAILLGPSAQYYTSARLVSKAGGQSSVDKIELSDEDDLRRFNVFGVAGAQIGVPLPFGKIVLDGRYRHQFSNTDKTDDSVFRARIFSATAGIMFNLGGN